MTSGFAAAIRAADVGVVISTLVADPNRCTGEELLAAADAAEEAGIRCLTMWPHHIASPHLPDSEERIAAWRGRVTVLETAVGFTRGATAPLDDEVRTLVDLAARLGASMITTCTLKTAIEDVDAAAEGLAQLGAATAREGVRVCLEFLPWTAVPDLATAWALTQQTGLDNVGLVLDTWHFHRQPGGPDYALLETIPADRIQYVQISDAGAEPEADLMTEALTRRRLPGDGVVDFRRLELSLAAIGADPLYTTEVYNSSLAAGGPRRAILAVQRALAGLTPQRAEA